MIVPRVFGPFALGYFFSYVFRVVNSVIAPDLERDLGIGAADLGLLTSAYFLTFALVQIPLGVVLDRLGPRKTEAALMLVAAAGAVAFALSSGLAGLVAGRALIGLGVSSCLMSALTAYVLWFPKEKLVLANACHMAAGGVGALAATAPVQWALGFTDWRGLFLGAGAATVLVAGLIMAVVPPEPPRPPRPRDEPAAGGGYGAIFRSGVFWRIAPVTVASQASFLAIHGLWSGPWLRDVAGLERAAVGDHLFLIAGCMVIGMLSAGWVIERLGRIGIPTMTAVITLTCVFMVIQVGNALNLFDPALPGWLLFGLFGNTGVLAFAALSGAFPKRIAGRVVSALNLLCILGAWAAQWGIGVIIARWPATAAGGYAPEGYRAAFLVALALQAAAVAWFLLYRRPITVAAAE